jgi:hypothetical protein
MDLEQNSVSDQTTTGTTSVDWAEAFKSPEFSAGLAEAIAKSLGTRSASDSQVAALERLGDVCPTSMAAVIHATGTHSSNAGMLIAPSFIGISGSTSGPQSSTATQFATTNGTAVSDSPSVLPIVSTEPSPGLNQAFILGRGRPPLPAKLVSQILAYKFVEMSELILENRESPATEVPSFVIEGSAIVPTTTASSRKRNEVSDILTWVECFTSYITVITAFRPDRSRDLLAYMALIIRIAKQFPGWCWSNYDRPFRLDAAASNSKNWSRTHSDLYHYHTSVAF